MRIVFSFDDGRDDAYNAYKILKKYNLKGSFHITTGFIDGSYITDVFGVGRKPLSIDNIREMFQGGMDISSHGDKHIMNTDDFIVSVNKVELFCGSKLDRVGFSVPNSKFVDKELNSFADSNSNKLAYVRVGRSKKCYSFFSKINYVLYHLLHRQCFFNMFNKFNVITNVDKYRINSLVVKSDTRVDDLISFIDRYKDKDLSLVMMFHSIVDNPSDEWEYSTPSFEKLCSYISNNSIRCVTLKEFV